LNTKCRCKKNEFCDICLDNALNEMVKRGYLERIINNGEYKWVNKKNTRLDPEPRGISWSSG